MSNPQNGLIALLPARDRKRLLAQCEPTQLELADVICEAGSPLQHVHFPVDAFISLLAVEGEHSRLEVGMVGHEGMLGVHQFLGVAKAPLRALVQGAGTSLRMAAGDFQAEVMARAALQTVMSCHVHVCMQQLATSALCLRFHQVGPRLARWLLMTQDRSCSDRFHVTQEFLSTMLGVRRVGVTAAARLLQERELIATTAATCRCVQLLRQRPAGLRSAIRATLRPPVGGAIRRCGWGAATAAQALPCTGLPAGPVWRPAGPRAGVIDGWISWTGAKRCAAVWPG